MINGPIRVYTGVSCDVPVLFSLPRSRTELVLVHDTVNMQTFICAALEFKTFVPSRTIKYIITYCTASYYNISHSMLSYCTLS